MHRNCGRELPVSGRAYWLAAIVLAAGCGAARSPAPSSARAFVESGFLTDYSRLAPAEAGSHRYVYRNPNSNLARYGKLHFDRITIWRDATEKMELQSSDLQKVADDLYAAMAERLGRKFALTNEAGPGVLRMRMAFTAVRDPDGPLDTYVTQAEENLADSKDPLPAGLRELAPAALMEAELLDAETGEVLYAVVDRVTHAVDSPQPVETWADLHRAFVAWGDRIGERLEARREHRTVNGTRYAFPGTHREVR